MRGLCTYRLIPAGSGASRSSFVAIDQETTPATTDSSPRLPVFENEIPTYRAVSSRAVFAVLCGLMSVFSFAHPAFYLFAILAVVLGVTADRKIQQHP
jgi:hypothetical protein